MIGLISKVATVVAASASAASRTVRRVSNTTNRQSSNMESTARRRESQANRVASTVRTATSPAQAEQRARDAARLRHEATRLRRASSRLQNEKEREVRRINRTLDEMSAADRRRATHLLETLRQLENDIRRLQAVRDNIRTAFPMTNNTANIIAAASITSQRIAEGSLNSPVDGIRNAAVRLNEVASSTFNTSIASGATFAGTQQVMANGFDPINLSTGNFYYEKEDLSIAGRYPLEFKRFYNAIGGFDTILGKNWTHNYNIRLFTNGEVVSIIFGDGHVENYTRLEDGFYVAQLEHKNTLTLQEEGKDGFYLILPTMERYSFGENGSLTCIDDTNGNKTMLEYDGGGILLTKVKSASGSLAFEYNDNGQMINVTDHTGRSVIFEYEGDTLTKVTHPTGAAFSYKYDGKGGISGITNPMGIDSVYNEYDSKGRAVYQKLADGGEARLEYDDTRMVTVTTDQAGNKTEYYRDEKYRTVGIKAGDNEQRYEYDDSNNLIKYTDSNKNTWHYEYDIFGNITKTADPLNNITTIEYNNHNKPTKVTAPNDGIISLTYDDYGNITAVNDPLNRQINFINDINGKVTELTLPDLSQNTVEYDERGNITVITDSMGVKTHYEYDGLNRVSKTTNGEGFTTSFEYNVKGDIEKVTDAYGNTRTYEYNLTGKVTKIVDFNGGVIEYKYNKTGRIEEVTDQAGGITKLDYDLLWNITGITNAGGGIIKYEYDRHNRVTRTVDEEGNSTDYRHDPNGNIVEVTLPTGAKTNILYDELNRQKKIIEPDGAETFIEYDTTGNITQVTDAMGNTYKREYDTAGQLVKLTDPLNNETSFTYTPLGQIENIINADGEKQTRSYYPGGRLKSVSLPCGETETYEYDKNGNVTKVTDALGSSTTIKYDSLDRVTETINALGHNKRYEYDAIGNIIQVRDENNNITQYKYSPLNDVAEVTDAMGHSTKYSYDSMKRMVKFEQYNNNEPQIVTYERNSKGEVVKVTSQLGDVVKYDYDKLGNVISKHDEDGYKTTYDYDISNKLTKIGYADGKTVELTYNPLKQLTEMKDWLGTTTIELDALGRASKVTDFSGTEVSYGYNNLGQRERLTYPNGKEVRYEYDASGRLERVTDGADVTSYQYDLMGRISDRIMGEDITTKYTFNALGALTGLTHSKLDNILDQFKYTYDPAGNITEIDKYRKDAETDNGLFKYAYDPLNRLTDVMNKESSRQYTYDTIGNRVTKQINQFTDNIAHLTEYSYNARNQLINDKTSNSISLTSSKTASPPHIFGESIINEYSYDKRGNMTQTVENGINKATYTFDATNMMVGAVTDKGVAEYRYNGFRNRVKMLENMKDNAISSNQPDPTRELRYVLDMTLPYNNLLETYDDKNTVQQFTWGNSLLSGSNNNITDNNNGNSKNNYNSTFYYLQDHLGSPIRLTNETANDNIMIYDEFGLQEVQNINNVNQSATNTQHTPQTMNNTQTMNITQTINNPQIQTSTQRFINPFTFTGYQVDDITNMHFAQARYYNPNNGRFGAEDPIKDQFNWYGYCNNNPTNWLDPSGLVNTARGQEQGGITQIELNQNQWQNNDKISWSNVQNGLINTWTNLQNSITNTINTIYSTGVIWGDFIEYRADNTANTIYTAGIDVGNFIEYRANVVAYNITNTVNSVWQNVNNTCPHAVIRGDANFYKGHPVVWHGIGDGSAGVMGIMWLNINAYDTDWGPGHVGHEWGHLRQERILGIFIYVCIIGVPSIISFKFDRENHDYRWFERNADWIRDTFGSGLHACTCNDE